MRGGVCVITVLIVASTPLRHVDRASVRLGRLRSPGPHRAPPTVSLTFRVSGSFTPPRHSNGPRHSRAERH